MIDCLGFFCCCLYFTADLCDHNNKGSLGTWNVVRKITVVEDSPRWMKFHWFVLRKKSFGPQPPTLDSCVNTQLWRSRGGVQSSGWGWWVSVCVLSEWRSLGLCPAIRPLSLPKTTTKLQCINTRGPSVSVCMGVKHYPSHETESSHPSNSVNLQGTSLMWHVTMATVLWNADFNPSQDVAVCVSLVCSCSKMFTPVTCRCGGLLSHPSTSANQHSGRQSVNESSR